MSGAPSFFTKHLCSMACSRLPLSQYCSQEQSKPGHQAVAQAWLQHGQHSSAQKARPSTCLKAAPWLHEMPGTQILHIGLPEGERVYWLPRPLGRLTHQGVPGTGNPGALPPTASRSREHWPQGLKGRPGFWRPAQLALLLWELQQMGSRVQPMSNASVRSYLSWEAPPQRMQKPSKEPRKPGSGQPGLTTVATHPLDAGAWQQLQGSNSRREKLLGQAPYRAVHAAICTHLRSALRIDLPLLRMPCWGARCRS